MVFPYQRLNMPQLLIEVMWSKLCCDRWSNEMIYCRASDKDASLSPGWWENINLTSTPCIINNAATATGAAIQFAIVSNFSFFFLQQRLYFSCISYTLNCRIWQSGLDFFIPIVKYRNYTFTVYSRITLGGSPFFTGQQKADLDWNSYLLLPL